ncbi:HNH endonuclease signature motif containing protein [Pseudonocardia hydrocarbonoxydans]|nr:HNH endonuclease signature motif containing protein [Pseudonocardia hydrocarbonoxydans]
MAPDPLRAAHQHLAAALEELATATRTASDTDLVSVLTLCEGLSRRVDAISVSAVATLDQRGVFLTRGYTCTARALADLLGWTGREARRHVVAATDVHRRATLGGEPLPARLPATAAAFSAGDVALRHVEVIGRVLSTPAARRLTPERWSGAEAQLAVAATTLNSGQLETFGTTLVERLDEDGAEPDDTAPPNNELRLVRHRGGAGGSIRGRYSDAALFDAIAAVIDAQAAPLTSDDHRTAPQRQAEALADVCAHVLAHGRDLPEVGGRRPQLTVIVRLEDLERRARAATLEFGGTLTPGALRALACDAGVVPVVMNGAGQPLDVGRGKRTIPDGLRRAVTVRDRGCAHPGCDRPPSWCEVHHVRHWAHGGPTELGNLVMLCRAHHRQVHHCDWLVRIRDGLPEFVPPRWIDPDRTPRRNAPVHLVA